MGIIFQSNNESLALKIQRNGKIETTQTEKAILISMRSCSLGYKQLQRCNYVTYKYVTIKINKNIEKLTDKSVSLFDDVFVYGCLNAGIAGKQQKLLINNVSQQVKQKLLNQQEIQKLPNFQQIPNTDYAIPFAQYNYIKGCYNSLQPAEIKKQINFGQKYSKKIGKMESNESNVILFYDTKAYNEGYFHLFYVIQFILYFINILLYNIMDNQQKDFNTKLPSTKVVLPSPCSFNTIEYKNKLLISVKKQYNVEQGQQIGNECLSIEIQKRQNKETQINVINNAYTFTNMQLTLDLQQQEGQQPKQKGSQVQGNNGGNFTDNVLFINNWSACKQIYKNKSNYIQLDLKDNDHVLPINNQAYVTCKYNTKNFDIFKLGKSQNILQHECVNLGHSQYLQYMLKMNECQAAVIYSNRYCEQRSVGAGIFTYDVESKQIPWSYKADTQRNCQIVNNCINIDNRSLLVGCIQHYFAPKLFILDTRVSGIVSIIDIDEPVPSYIPQLNHIRKISNYQYATISSAYGLRIGNLIKFDIRFPQRPIVIKQSIPHFRYFHAWKHQQTEQYWCMYNQFVNYKYAYSILQQIK